MPPLPPLQEIPAHVSARKASPKKVQNKLGDSNLAKESPSATLPSESSTSDLPNPFSMEANPAIAEMRVLLRTEEQQQAAAREREEKEALDAENDLTARREARRKSLANRRVSFAPEATLHTWDVVEYLQDSTASSSSTNSTRRASSMSSGIVDSPRPQTPGHFGSDSSELPSTPPEQIEDTIVASSAHQRDLHQKKRRRSSTIPPLNFNNPDDEVFSSSPSSGDSVAEDDLTNPGFVDEDGDENSDSNSDSDNEGTAMSLDVGNTTDMSMASMKSDASSTGSSARLEEALQLAARQAGTQGIDFDEHGNYGTAQEEEVVASFQPWSKTGGLQLLSPSQDQENLKPFSPAFKAGLQAHGDDGGKEDDVTMDMTRAVGRIMPTQQSDDEMTMDMTVAVGGIMQTLPETSAGNRRKSVASGRRQSTRRRSSAELSSLGDETMDLTMAIGGIQQGQDRDETRSDAMDDEDMTMELTSVIGGVLLPGRGAPVKGRRQSSAARRESIRGKKRHSEVTSDDEAMDMTVAVGGILSTNTKGRESGEMINVDMDMDMTTAFGGILPKQLSTGSRYQPKHLEQEGQKADLMSSPFQAVVPSDAQQKVQAATVASETGSPSLAAFRGKGLRRSGVSRNSTTPKSIKNSDIGTPNQKPSTPSKQRTPKYDLPTATIKETPQKDAVTRSKSPKQKSEDKFRTESSTTKSSTLNKSLTPNKLFQKDHTTGVAIPGIILTPQKRRSSGIGADRVGLGSPQVAALLDRRASIGDQAIAFTFGDVARGVRFDNPQVIEKELDRERQEEKDREDGRKIMEREADSGEGEKDATINLKEMIQSLTPKKRPLNGRKSLHVGAAKGILGKRPAELDEDDQDHDDDQGGVKRLKNHQDSPVKNVKLQAPPSKAETTGRLTRAARRSLQETPANIITPTTASPLKPSVTTPKSQGRFREPEASAQEVVPFVEKSPVDNPVVDEEEYGDERIQLQDFLNMTSIRFMELTTTKRRHTVAPNGMQDGLSGLRHENDHVDGSLESCVVAGACTVPMLELFQHSCRELKKYISEGRSIVREIETETFEENPPLFREYMSATPDVRVLMDNQFKNVKTHARLLSKGMWYEWRMKLLDGLKDGLYKISEGMEVDAEALQHQQDLLDSTLPQLVEKYEKVAEEEADLQTAAEELASCDQEELSDARQRLVSVDVDIVAKRRMIQDLRRQIQEKEISIAAVTEKKKAYLSDIEEAEKVREACRGWSADEGLALKGISNLPIVVSDLPLTCM
jgi:kinetochore protein Spc7/SPC105